VLVIEDPNRFRKSRSVGTYLGLCPRRRDSGEQRPQLRISKAGDPLLRRLLVTAAHYVLGPFGPDTNLRHFGLALAERGEEARRGGRGATAGGAAPPPLGDGRGLPAAGLRRPPGEGGVRRPKTGPAVAAQSPGRGVLDPSGLQLSTNRRLRPPW
jgi:Transposase IS116/IS110/IS902 family